MFLINMERSATTRSVGDVSHLCAAQLEVGNLPVVMWAPSLETRVIFASDILGIV